MDWFKKVDADGNGAISLSEAIQWESAIKIAPSQTEENFKQVDASGDGGINFEEFRATFNPPSSDDCKRLADPAEKFAQIDRDGNGSLSFNEVVSWAEVNRPALGLSDVKAGFQKSDGNADGVLQPEEVDRSLAGKTGKPSGF